MKYENYHLFISKIADKNWQEYFFLVIEVVKESTGQQK
jgi:hypothetical protein